MSEGIFRISPDRPIECGPVLTNRGAAVWFEYQNQSFTQTVPPTYVASCRPKHTDNTTYLRDGTLLFSPGSIPGAAGTFSMDGLLLGALDTRCIGEMKRIPVSVVRGMRREGGKLNLRLCQHPSHVNEIQTSSLRRQGFKNSIGKSFSNRYTSRL